MREGGEKTKTKNFDPISGKINEDDQKITLNKFLEKLMRATT